MEQNNNDIKKIKGKKLIIIITVILISVMVGVVIGVGISKGDDLLGFLGAILGALSAYILFKLESISDKKKEEKQKEEEREYKNQMLYTLIDHTLLSTKEQYDILEKLYATNYEKLEKYVKEKNEYLKKIEDNVYEDIFKLSKNLSMDIEDIEILRAWKEDNKSDNVSIEVYRTLENHFKNKTLKSNSLIRGFYDRNWISYIDCVEDGRERYDIINWLTMLQSLDKSISLSDFIFYRSMMFNIIKKNYPKIKEYGSAYRIDSTKKGYSRRYYK